MVKKNSSVGWPGKKLIEGQTIQSWEIRQTDGTKYIIVVDKEGDPKTPPYVKVFLDSLLIVVVL